ncbi:MAG: DUF2789 domain-containing protein [Aestuariibacter sp.]
MLTNTNPTLTDLFAQLGLENSDSAIESFVSKHRPLPAEVHIEDASFWNESQKAFIQFEIEEDAEWAEVIDTLSSMLR